MLGRHCPCPPGAEEPPWGSKGDLLVSRGIERELGHTLLASQPLSFSSHSSLGREQEPFHLLSSEGDSPNTLDF